jgi:ATP adenylyltransferase
VDIISAGWRMQYIEQADADECIFCRKPLGSDQDNLIVRRGESAFVIMNLYPYTTGHIMVAPYRHVGSISDLTEQESREIMTLLGWSEQVLRRGLEPDGFNMGMNIGRCAGAGYPDHIHVHVVPRWEGDANFMPILSEVKVLPETLQDTYKKIMDAKSQLDDER